MNLNSFEIENNMLPNTAKKLSQFTNFPANMFLFGVRKKAFPDSQELLSWSTLKANVCIFLYISLKIFLFQRRRKILSGGMKHGERLNNFLKAARCLSLVNFFAIFHFDWHFSKFNYFSVFRYFHQYCWNAKIFQTIWTSKVRLWLNFS